MSSEKLQVSEKTAAIDNESTNEKGQVSLKHGASSSSSDIELAGPTFDGARTGRLLRKMDWNIVPFLSLLYLYVIFISLHIL
jgi:hypothetical protein